LSTAHELPLLPRPYPLPLRYVPSFPVRRSSDLLRAGRQPIEAGIIEAQRIRLRRSDRPQRQDGGPRRIVPPRAAILTLGAIRARSEEHTSELQSRFDLVCRLLLEKKKDSDLHDP